MMMRSIVVGLVLWAAAAGCAEEAACEGASTVHAGDVVLERDATAIPSGLACVEVITGDLEVLDTRLSSLAGLERLRHVQGDLRLIGNERLESVAGLERLQRVDGDVSIASNEALEDLSALAALEHVGESLELSSLPRLEALPELTLTSTIGGDLALSSLGALETIDGFTVGAVAGNVSISYNPALRELDALLAPMSVGGGVLISGNDRLTALGVLPRLRFGDLPPSLPPGRWRVAPRASFACGDRAWLAITHNAALERIEQAEDGLVEGFDGCLELADNPKLTEVRLELPLVSTIESLELDELPMLETFVLGAGPQSVRRVRDRLWIHDIGLPSLDALDGVVEVGCDVQVTENAALAAPVLPELRRANRVWVHDNALLDGCVLETWAAALAPARLRDDCAHVPADGEVVQVSLTDNASEGCE